jgi:misacylated tRNA(Ala) deacylase
MNSIPNHDTTEGSDLSQEARAPDTASREEVGAVKKEVDPRMHSAEHILTTTLMVMLRCARPFTTHLERKKSKADYRYTRDLTTEETKQVEARVNEVIARNLSVWEEFLLRSQAERLYDLVRLPESAGEAIRVVHIGDYDACPCSGKHVDKTTEIGGFRIVSTTYESGALRVRFKLDASSDMSQ